MGDCFVATPTTTEMGRASYAPLRLHCSLCHSLDDYQSTFLPGSTRIPTLRGCRAPRVIEIFTGY